MTFINGIYPTSHSSNVNRFPFLPLSSNNNASGSCVIILTLYCDCLTGRICDPGMFKLLSGQFMSLNDDNTITFEIMRVIHLHSRPLDSQNMDYLPVGFLLVNY